MTTELNDNEVPQKTEKKGTSTGLDPNIAGLLCYVLGWITGIVFLVLEKEDKFVRFHAIQSIITFGAITAVLIGLGILENIPIIGILFFILQVPIMIVGFILWIILMVKAYQSEEYKLPWAGDIAAEHI
ncbi:MAG: DUF4870 domain-containing protein [Chloroflexota bacterium]|nr:DUF4870 domain-containing protein [Chloroflexota bacterium]